MNISMLWNGGPEPRWFSILLDDLITPFVPHCSHPKLKVSLIFLLR
jgi:hypothetical protein